MRKNPSDRERRGANSLDDRFISYLYCFNELRDYFECHEYGESVWLDSGRPTLLKGLIQAAVCLYHLEGGNARGGWRMWNRAREYLKETDEYEGTDIHRLVQDIDDVWQHVPEAWRRESLTREQVQSLQLPTVQIQINNEELKQVVADWTIPSHAHEESD